MRVENGSLAEITGELVRLSPRGGAVPGTVIMLGSAVMLGVESVAHYAAEWKKCRNISSLGRYVFGSEISYNKAPPRLPGLGC